jgi:RNA polymerase sigma factor (sigma-70 family)
MMGDVEPIREVDPYLGSNVSAPIQDHEAEFRTFVVENEPRLRRAFVAAYGSQRGREATSEALAYAWEHWEQLQSVTNITGYLYRVGQSRTRSRKTHATFQIAPEVREQLVEPGLPKALESLSPRQRTAVVLIHGYGWTLREVADHMGLKITSVQNHLERGLHKLRRQIGETT